MSDSSEDDAPFVLREEEESGDEQPRKRRKTMPRRTLRGRGLGFVKSTGEDEEPEDEDVDDERPTMSGLARSSFQLGEYEEPEDDRRPTGTPTRSPPPVARPSAFGKHGAPNSFAAKMMAKMGYQEGKGLGVKGEGIVNPIMATGTAHRAGLGTGVGPQASDERKHRPEKRKDKSQSSTPGTGTPRRQPAPKTQYQTVADIEAKGLAVPAVLKSIIIDATGPEQRVLSSSSGLMTPNGDTPPGHEAVKIAKRAKRDLDAFAEAWSAEKEHAARLEVEDAQWQAELEANGEMTSRVQTLMAAVERVNRSHTNPAEGGTAEGGTAAWDQCVEKLQNLQTQYADYIEEYELPELAAATLEGPLKQEMVAWQPLEDPGHLTSSFESLEPLLQWEEGRSGRRRKQTSYFESLLLRHWYPRIRTALHREWDVHNPEPAVQLITTWQTIIPDWMTLKLMDEVVVPKLTSALNVYRPDRNGGDKHHAPPLHAWLFDWWSLLSTDDLNSTNPTSLIALVRSKLDSTSWPIWKPLLGERRPRRPAQPVVLAEEKTAAPVEQDEITFREVVEQWCSEEDLVMLSLHRPNDFGLPLYRIKPADNTAPGVVVYLRGDVVWSAAGEPWALDERLVERARGGK